MIKTVNDKIYIIENYISIHTANLLVKIFDEYLIDSPDYQIKGGPSLSPNDGYKFKLGNPIVKYNGVQEHDIACDILTMTCTSMENTISSMANRNMDIKTMFYGAMFKGSKNNLHVDNYFEINNENTLRENSKDDWSGLLYLNNDYEGGELEFTEENFLIKPDPGTFIFFQGSHNLPHRVNEVLNGKRNVIVSFFWPIEYRGFSTILG